MTTTVPPRGAADGSLTDEAFWDDRWASMVLPSNIDEGVRWQLAMADVFRRFLEPGTSRDVFEIGCAPGRWLVWMYRTFGYTAYGCDLSRTAAETTRANLAISGVPGEIYTADITTGRDLPDRQYDVVLSVGVIEHFDDPLPVVRRHVDLLKPGGTLILNVPNLAGRVNHTLLRAARMQSLIDVHNIRMMNTHTFHDFAEQCDLEVRFLDYVGGFDPGLVVYNHSYPSVWKRPLALHALWAMERVTRRWPRLGLAINHPSFSNMLVGVYRRRP